MGSTSKTISKLNNNGQATLACQGDKAVSLHWEPVFTRSLFDTPDMAEQRKLLNVLAKLVDAGRIRSGVTDVAAKLCIPYSLDDTVAQRNNRGRTTY